MAFMGKRASLEGIIEAGWIDLEYLHPGGLDLTLELARMCRIGPGSRTLDVAAGTGTSASALATRLDADVVALDISAAMIERVDAKRGRRGADRIRPVRADAAALPFAPRSFDAVVSECSLCLLDKEGVLAEMVRVARPGGWVGMHNLCWEPRVSGRVRRRLARIEGEEPETVDGWRRLFTAAGLEAIEEAGHPSLVRDWIDRIEQDLGPGTRLRLAARAVGRWGPRGLADLLRASRLLRSRSVGYVVMAGRKPS